VVLGAVKATEAASNAADGEHKAPAALWGELKSAGLLDPGAPTP
jgi:hypothetical protein